MGDDCTCPPLRLKPFDLTHLRYHHNDALGSLMALASLIPIFIPFGGFPAHVLATRSVRSLLFWLGLVVDHALNSVIKHRIGIPRPPQHCSALEVCGQLGMPSAHSQFMAFFSAYITLVTVTRHRFEDRRWKLLQLSLPWALTAVTMASRVYLGYHSVPQVFAGASLGLLTGSLWFLLVERVIGPFLPALVTTPLGKYLCLRDDAHIPNVPRFEHTNSSNALNSLKDGTKDE